MDCFSNADTSPALFALKKRRVAFSAACALAISSFRLLFVLGVFFSATLTGVFSFSPVALPFLLGHFSFSCPSRCSFTASVSLALNWSFLFQLCCSEFGDSLVCILLATDPSVVRCCFTTASINEYISSVKAALPSVKNTRMIKSKTCTGSSYFSCQT